MLDWKIILTVMITLGLVLVYVGANSGTTDFFGSIGDRISSLTGDNAPRNVAFSLATDSYAPMTFSVNDANFTIEGYTTAVLKTGNLVTNKTLGISGFRGTGSIDNGMVVLNGRIARVELPDITVALQETIQSNSTFSSLSARDIGVKEVKIHQTSGTLTVGNTTMSFRDDIDLLYPMGDFNFYRNNVTFSLSGRANKIILDNGITIG